MYSGVVLSYLAKSVSNVFSAVRSRSAKNNDNNNKQVVINNLESDGKTGLMID